MVGREFSNGLIILITSLKMRGGVCSPDILAGFSIFPIGQAWLTLLEESSDDCSYASLTRGLDIQKPENASH